MHEASLAADLLRQITDIACAQRVKRVKAVRVKASPLTHVSESHLRDHFALASKGTVAEGAEIDLVQLPLASAPDSVGFILESLEVED